MKVITEIDLPNMLLSEKKFERELAMHIMQDKTKDVLKRVFEKCKQEINDGRSMKLYVFDFLFNGSK